MELLARYIHGSADSTDVDVVYVVDAIPSPQESKAFCSADKSENRNIITIDARRGVVSGCYKGSIDEINNSLFETYNLHHQTDPLMIRFRRCRDIAIKCMRSTRIVLSHLSRSQYRKYVKDALRGSWNERLLTLEMLMNNLAEIDFDTLNKNMSGDDIKKAIAFQVGQCCALIGGVEIYTKMGLSWFYPYLKPYLYRKSENIDDLKIGMHLFLSALSYDVCDISGIGETTQIRHGNKIYDLINEVKIS